MKKIILESIRVLLIILFVYAAVNKIMDIQKFRAQIGQSPMLTNFAGIIAWTIPPTEILIALCLSIPKYRLIGFYASLSLMTLFTGYIIAVTQFSTYIPCSCGGILEKLGWTEHLIFNIIIVLLAVIAIIIYPTSSNIQSTEPNTTLST